jgi:hypothetical protein
MLFSWIPVRLHAWLDEGATLAYWLSAYLFGFHDLALAALIAAGVVHFTNTRMTDYPRGNVRLYGMAVHARIELCEGGSIAAASLILPGMSLEQRVVMAVLGGLQIGAALFADLRWPRSRTESPDARVA